MIFLHGGFGDNQQCHDWDQLKSNGSSKVCVCGCCEQMQPLGYFAGKFSLAAAELDIWKLKEPFLHPARCSGVSLLMVGFGGLKDLVKDLLLINTKAVGVGLSGGDTGDRRGWQ